MLDQNAETVRDAEGGAHAGRTDRERARARKPPSPAQPSRAAVQRMRHAADAVLTGIGTVLADDPLLTDRTGLPRRRPLAARGGGFAAALAARIATCQDAQRTTCLFSRRQECDAAKARRTRTRRRGSGPCGCARGRVDLGEVIRELGRRQILNLLIEAGAELNGAALAGGIVDKMVLFYAPRIMGTAECRWRKCLMAGSRMARRSRV